LHIAYIDITLRPVIFAVWQVKDLFKAIGEVKYVEYSTGENFAYIRVADSESAIKIQKSLETGIALNDANDSFTWYLLSGEEEQLYWAKIEKSNKGHSKEKSGGGRGGRGRGRGGRGGRRFKR